MAEPKLICNYKNKSQAILETCQIWSNLTIQNSNDSVFECEFETLYYGRTLVSEWGLFCEKKYLVSLIKTFYLFGMVSSFVTGPISDIYGRKFLSIGILFAMFFNLVIIEISSLLNFSFTIRYIIYSLAHFLNGLFSNTIYSTLCILLLEITTSKYSNIVNNFNLYMYVFGELVILAFSYFLRDWHTINWVNLLI
jgi:MFS family permease